MCDNTKANRIRRVMVWIAVALATAWLVADIFADIRAFFSEHHGFEFYRERPYVLALCPMLAIVVGLCIKVVLDFKPLSRRGISRCKGPKDAV